MNHTLTYRPKSPGTNIGGYRYFFNGQEADNEVFEEVANFGYEFRQYDSRLVRWWSADPKWNEYPSVSPFVFCNGSPIILMDPKGDDIFPEYTFIGTTYEKVHNYMLKKNSFYLKACQPFISNNHYNLYLNCNKSLIPEGYKGFTDYTFNYKKESSPNTYPGNTYIITDVTSTESFHPDMAKSDISLWHFYIIIHEMGHTMEAFDYKAAKNNKQHNGFMLLIDDQIKIWNELNNDLSLGLSLTQIKELCMYGAEESSDFNQYINNLVLKNGTNKQQEIDAYHQRIQQLFENYSNINISDSNQ